MVTGGGDGGGGGGGPSSTGGEESEPGILELLLLSIQEVFVYRVPPLQAASGHRAEDWGLANPMLTCSMKIYGLPTRESCSIRLFKQQAPPTGGVGDSSTGEQLFVDCLVALGKGRTLQQTVEGVMDSSRYFVLRCEDKMSKRVAYIGVGFRERSTAFDFKAALDDFARSQERARRATEQTHSFAGIDDEDGEGSLDTPVKQLKDMSLHEGEKIHIELSAGSSGSGRRRKKVAESGGGGSSSGGAAAPMKLAPPPPAGSIMKPSSLSQNQQNDLGGGGGGGGDDDDWGDFASAG